MENVYPIKKMKIKTDRFAVYLGDTTNGNLVFEGAEVGHAMMKPGTGKFHLTLWMFEKCKYYILPKDASQVEYDILTHKEYMLPDGTMKQHWNKVGEGLYFGNYLKLSFHLFEKELFLSLFPKNNQPKKVQDEKAS